MNLQWNKSMPVQGQSFEKAFQADYFGFMFSVIFKDPICKLTAPITSNQSSGQGDIRFDRGFDEPIGNAINQQQPKNIPADEKGRLSQPCLTASP